MRAFAFIWLVLVGVAATPVLAQSSNRGLEVGAHVSTLQLNEFDITDTGIGVTTTWRVAPAIAIDGALTAFPGDRDFVGDRIASQRRTLGVVGARSGIRRGPVELFGRARAGFLHFAEQESAVCVAISAFPTPLGCQLAAGYTALAVDLGGGVTVGAGRLHLRFDAGDLVVRYGLKAFRRSGKLTDGFSSHNLQASAGLGWRF